MLVKVLDKGHVQLDWFAGGDLDVVNAAKVSFAKRVDSMGPGEEKLIEFLMKNRHGTPFEHCTFKFSIKCPISVMREWIRHRVSSFNEMSGRYVKLEPDFYVPKPEDVRGQIGKPGHYTFDTLPLDKATDFILDLECEYRRCYAFYERALADGVAKELARQILPVGLYTQFVWTVNPRSLMNFLSLRNSLQAMAEIREYAVAIEQIFAEQMPVTYRAFVENGRTAP